MNNNTNFKNSYVQFLNSCLKKEFSKFALINNGVTFYKAYSYRIEIAVGDEREILSNGECVVLNVTVDVDDEAYVYTVFDLATKITYTVPEYVFFYERAVGKFYTENALM